MSNSLNVQDSLLQEILVAKEQVVSYRGQRGVINPAKYVCGCGTEYLVTGTFALSNCVNCGRPYDPEVTVMIQITDASQFDPYERALQAIREADGSKMCPNCNTWHSVGYTKTNCSKCGAPLVSVIKADDSDVAATLNPVQSGSQSKRRRVTQSQPPYSYQPVSFSVGTQWWKYALGFLAVIGVIVSIVMLLNWYKHQYVDVAVQKDALILRHSAMTGYTIRQRATELVRNTTEEPSVGAYNVSQYPRSVQVTYVARTTTGKENMQVQATPDGKEFTCGSPTKMPNGSFFQPVCTKQPPMVNVVVTSGPTPVYDTKIITVFYYDYTMDRWIPIEDRRMPISGMTLVTPTYQPSGDIRIDTPVEELTLVLRVDDAEISWRSDLVQWSRNTDETMCQLGYSRAGQAIKLTCPGETEKK